MTKNTLTLLIFMTIAFQLFGQNNPVENLTWDHSYDSPYNNFDLQWDEPLQPHNNLIGYNIYRDNELYRFQTEKTLYNFHNELYGLASNCPETFLEYGNGAGFNIHVTAVYDPDQVESGYSQTFYDYGFLLTTTNFIQKKGILFPNPTNDVLNIGNENLEKIVIYDISGKEVKEFAPALQINVSNLSKGLYIIKLFSEQGIIIDKILID